MNFLFEISPTQPAALNFAKKPLTTKTIVLPSSLSEFLTQSRKQKQYKYLCTSVMPVIDQHSFELGTVQMYGKKKVLFENTYNLSTVLANTSTNNGHILRNPLLLFVLLSQPKCIPAVHLERNEACHTCNEQCIRP